MQTDPAAPLREQGIYVTAQRLAVLRAVGGQPHATAEEVLQLVRGEIGSISRQSVYGTLNTLTDYGLLRRIQPMGSPAALREPDRRQPPSPALPRVRPPRRRRLCRR